MVAIASSRDDLVTALQVAQLLLVLVLIGLWLEMYYRK